MPASKKSKKKKKRPRRPRIPGPFRKVIPPFETRLGVLLLALLALSVALLLWKSAFSDPKVFEAVAPEPRTTGLLNTIPERNLALLVGKGVLRAPSEARRSRLEDLSSALPKSLEPGGYKRSGKISFFSRDILYEKINGRAEIYLIHDVVGLACAEFSREGVDFPAEIYLYLMETELGTFGVFQAERDQKVPNAGIAVDSFYVGGSLYFRQGRVYGQVIGGEGWSEEMCKELSKGIVELLPKPTARSELDKHLSRLPSEGRIPRTEQHEPKAAFGFDDLKGVYHASYPDGHGGKLSLWYAMAVDVERAKSLKAAFVKGLGRRAEKLPEPKNEDLADASFYRVGKRYGCVFRWDKLVGGVLDASSLAVCEKKLDQLMATIDEVDDADSSEDGLGGGESGGGESGGEKGK